MVPIDLIGAIKASSTPSGRYGRRLSGAHGSATFDAMTDPERRHDLITIAMIGILACTTIISIGGHVLLWLGVIQ